MPASKRLTNSTREVLCAGIVARVETAPSLSLYDNYDVSDMDALLLHRILALFDVSAIPLHAY